jgi:hypothetical protein
MMVTLKGNRSLFIVFYLRLFRWKHGFEQDVEVEEAIVHNASGSFKTIQEAQRPMMNDDNKTTEVSAMLAYPASSASLPEFSVVQVNIVTRTC